MGGGQSKSPEYCKFSKIQFNYLLAIIKESHSVMQFYASANLLNKVPVKFIEYMTYPAEVEEYFNTRRNDPFQPTEDDPMGFYDTYLYIKNFKRIYEGLGSESERAESLIMAFTVTNSTVKKLVQELLDTCLGQM